MSQFILPLSDLKATLETVGGKGASLAKLSRAGLPVPGGFHLTTEAYRCFVADNSLQSRILAAIKAVDPALPASLEATSRQIGELFTTAPIPVEITAAISAAYAGIKDAPVAVRSSATAEDLPRASFAGQQETYLNIRGQDAVLQAVKHCWASLWTGRAIAYRAKQNIAPEDIALAVVVQELVLADAAGVMFTANPLNGRRDQLVINAAWGLGEAVVSGAVTPDTITVDRLSGRILRRAIAGKQVMTVRTDSGTREQPVPRPIQKKAVLSRSRAEELARLGGRIEDLYGMPMDIEWALSHGKFAILQARPITSLPEPPLDWTSPNPKALLMRMSFAEFVPGAVSPLFATLGVPMAEKAGQALMGEYMGQIGSDGYPFAVVNGYVYVGMVLGLKMVWAMAVALMRGAVQKMLKTSQVRWTAMTEKYHTVVDRWQGKVLAALSPTELLKAANEIFACTAECYSVAQAGLIPAASSSELSFSRFYNGLVKNKHDPEASIFLLGFDSLPLRAEKSLFDLARWIKEQPALATYVLGSPAKDVCEALQGGASPIGSSPAWGEFRSRFEAHLANFGHTVYDLDFAKPVPADDPAPLVKTLTAYLEGKGSDPYTRQRTVVEKREQATRAILKRLDPLRRKWFQKLLGWAQEAAPKREDCIGDLGLGYPVLRRVFAELGLRFMAGGAIGQPDDIYWLQACEAKELSVALEKGESLPNLTGQVEQRKAEWLREHDATVPPMLPEDSLIARMARHEHKHVDQLEGFGASSGRVTAPACVLRDPHDFGQMHPGNVIVAVTTTPAWTPLFAIASAVVTEIGGPLSHSSIVAREYGIPAVLGTGTATHRIHTGQIITVDGTAGRIILGNDEQVKE